jgi:hypothetical protein
MVEETVVHRPLWTANDVAANLRMSLSWVRQKTAAGILPHLRFGGRAVRYEPAQIILWRESSAAAGLPMRVMATAQYKSTQKNVPS